MSCERFKKIIQSFEERSVDSFRAARPFLIAAFPVGIVLSLLTAPIGLLSVEFRAVHLAFIGLMAASVVINAMVLKKLLEFAGVSRAFGEALRESAFSSIASIVPVLGTVSYKYLYLRSSDVSANTATRALFFSSVTFICVVLAVGFSGFIFSPSIGLCVLLICVFFLPLGCALAVRQSSGRLLIALASLQIALLMVELIRLWICFDLFQYSIGFDELAILQLANLTSIVGSASPGGIGLKEVGAAVIAPALAIPPSLVFLVFALNRIFGLISLAALVAVFFIHEKRKLDSTDNR